MSEIERFRLPSAQAEQIFDDHIAPTLLTAQSESKPIVTIVTAQPGAGKTTLSKVIATSQQLASDAPPTHVDVDMFKYFHPQFSSLFSSDPHTADDFVRADARQWFERSLDYLAGKKASLIVEHGLRDEKVTNKVIKRFFDAGYRIHVAFMATPAPVSRLGILERYQTNYEKTGVGRYVTEELHDARYRHLYDVADWIEDDPRVSHIAVYGRNTNMLSHRDRNSRSSNWVTPISTKDALAKEHNRRWGLEESRDFLRVHGSLTARMGPQWQPQLNAAHKAASTRLDPAAYTSPIHDKAAVTFGRYQIVSIAHLDTIRTILRDWPKVVIGVIDQNIKPTTPPTIPAHLDEFYRDCDANTAPAKNPMSVEERVALWNAALQAANMQGRVSIQVIPRPELDPSTFNENFPDKDYQLVFPAPAGEGFDRIRNNSFVEILDRDIAAVTPPLEYHTSDIRKAYRRGDEQAWKRGLAPGTTDLFVAVDGPRRLLAAPPEQNANPIVQPALSRGLDKPISFYTKPGSKTGGPNIGGSQKNPPGNPGRPRR